MITLSKFYQICAKIERYGTLQLFLSLFFHSKYKTRSFKRIRYATNQLYRCTCVYFYSNSFMYTAGDTYSTVWNFLTPSNEYITKLMQWIIVSTIQIGYRMMYCSIFIISSVVYLFPYMVAINRSFYNLTSTRTLAHMVKTCIIFECVCLH